MSSHHIVREKQEPALLVLGLDHFTDDELGQLLEWSPTVITTLPVAEQLVTYGIKVDYIITANSEEVLQSDVKIISPGGQSNPDAALRFLTNNGYPAVNIVTDEIDLPLYEVYAAQINLVIFYNRKKIYSVAPGYRKWKPAGENITIITHGIAVETEGLQQTDGQNYQTVADGFFSLKFNAPYIFISEEI